MTSSAARDSSIPAEKSLQLPIRGLVVLIDPSLLDMELIFQVFPNPNAVASSGVPVGYYGLPGERADCFYSWITGDETCYEY